VSRAAVQSAQLDLEAIEHDVVRLVGGEYRAILEVSGGASLLESEQRQEAILAGFAAFLNALTFPIQIVVRSAPVDLMRYVAALEERARQALPGALATLAHDHAAFVQGLARQRTLVERRFYVVVPAEATRRANWSTLFVRRVGLRQAADVEAAERQLVQRCHDVALQLQRCGLSVRRLADLELAQLFLACWSPERGRAQRVRQRLDDYSTLALRAASKHAEQATVG
jgi:hypothetical protein